jgi:hypothetical protein
MAGGAGCPALPIDKRQSQYDTDIVCYERSTAGTGTLAMRMPDWSPWGDEICGQGGCK